MSAREYTLFLDESGSFAPGDGSSCVAGLLVPMPLSRLPSPLLRDAILRDLPWLPWPLHARLYNLGGYHLALWHAADRRQRRSFPEPALFERLASLVDDYGDEDVVREALRAMADAARGEPDYGPIRTFDRWIAQMAPPREVTALRRIVLSVEERLRQQMLGLAAEAPGTVVVAAAAAPLGQPGRTSADGFLSSLEALLERVECVVGRLGAGPVWPVVAVRDVDAGGGLRRLDAVEVRARWEYAVRAVRGPHDEAASRFWPAKPQRFDHGCHAGLVLADFIANRLFRMELDHERPLAELVTTIGDSTGGVVEIGHGAAAFPTLAADGWARHAVTLAAGGGAEASEAATVSEALARTQLGWRREQALACVEARCWIRPRGD